MFRPIALSLTGFQPIRLEPVGQGGGSGEQTIQPFTIGTISFDVASLDVGIFSGGVASRVVDMFADHGHVVTARNDGVAGRTSDGVLAALPALLTTMSGFTNPVIVFSSVLGNDVTNAFNTYGRVDAAPASYWEERIATLNQIADLCEAAGVKPIFGNDSYRNYGLDDRCRADEDIGSNYSNRVYLEPWIKQRYPDQWDFTADRPMIDEYRWSWAIADWTYTDHIHLSGAGYHMRRRFLSDRIGRMANGQIPTPIPLVSWPLVPIASTQPRILFSFGNEASAANVPAVFNRSTATGSGINGRQHPAKIYDVNGAEIVGGFVRHFGQQNGLGDGRGSDGNTSPTLINDKLLKGSFYTGSAAQSYTEIGGLQPNAAVRLLYTASTAFSSADGDRVTNVYISGSVTPQTHIADEAEPNDILVLDGVTDPLGNITVTTVRAGGAINAYLSGIQVMGAGLLGSNQTPVVPPAPVALGLIGTDEPVTLTSAMLLAGAVDPDGDPLTVTDLTVSTGSGTITGSKPWIFTPSAGGNGVITYTISDSRGGTTTNTITYEAAANLWVHANAFTSGGSQILGVQRYRIYSSAGAYSSVQINDRLSGKSGKLFQFRVTIESITVGTSIVMGDDVGNDIIIAGVGTHTGTWIVNGPTANIKRHSGVTDMIIKDIKLFEVNRSPITATDISLGNLSIGTSTEITDATVLSGVTDPDGDVLTVIGYAVHSGSATITGSGPYILTPTGSGAGSASFTISDGRGGVVTRSVTWNKVVPPSPVSLGPIVIGEPIVITSAQLLSGASDPNGDALSVTSLTVSTGSGTITGTGPWTFAASAEGDGVISYTISNGKGGTATGTITYNAAKNLWVHSSVAVNGGSQILGEQRYRIYSASGGGSEALVNGAFSGVMVKPVRMRVEIESFTLGNQLLLGDTLGADNIVSGVGIKIVTWVADAANAKIGRIGITDAIVKDIYLRVV